jgi:hypothetical protein
MATASGSIAYLGAARFQGFWDASTNNATGSGLPGGKWNNIADTGMKGLFSTGSQNASGYAGDHLVSASAGDYWQVSGSSEAAANTGIAGTHRVGDIVSWQLNDWCVYSSSAGGTGEWVRLGYRDTIASVILGDLSAPDVFHLTGGANTHVLFVTGTVDGNVAFSGSKNFTFDYDNNSLGVTGTFVLDGNATLGDGDSDITTVNSRLTASAGLHVSEKAIFVHDVITRGTVVLGDAAADVATITGQLTASEGIYATKRSIFAGDVEIGGALHGGSPLVISGSVLMGTGCDDSIGISGSLTASCDSVIKDDTKIYFGSDHDAYIEFDESYLIISGASPLGTKVSGNVALGNNASDIVTIPARLTASEGILASKKSYFSGDIEVDGFAKFDGSVMLGDAAADMTVATSQFTASEGILASKKSTFSASVLVTDDTKVYFGTDHDAYIEFDDTHLIISGASPAGTRVSGNIVLGNNASDIVTVSARLTASEGILASKQSYFNDSVVLGDAAADVVQVNGQLTASEGIQARKKSYFLATTLITDDTKLYFGSDHDSYIEFDETNLVISGSGGSGGGVTVSGTLLVSDDTQFGADVMLAADKKIRFGVAGDPHIEYDTGGINDYLVISGSSAGLVLSGTSVIIDGTLEGASPLSVGDVLLADDKKIYFGTDSDAYIEYDSSFLIISGASPHGTKVSGNIILGGASDQTTISGPLVISSDVAAGTGASPIDVALNGNLSCSANLTVGGNLLVNGTTVTQDVVNSVIQDPIIGLGYGVTGSTDASTGSAGDRGLVMGITGSNAVAMIWDNSATQFAFVTTANNPDDIEITPATYEDLRVSAIDIGGAAILDADGVTKVQHDVTGALGGLKHDAGKLFVDLKNLPSGTTNMVATDLMVFQDGHASGSTRVLPISKLLNLVTASGDAAVTAINNATANRLTTIGSTTTELDGEANLTYDGTTFVVNDDARVNDDFPLYFGSNSDALIKYRETGDNLLVISGSKGSTGGLVLSGSKLFIDTGTIASGTLAGQGSYLGVTATGQVVLGAPTSSGGGGSGDITAVVAGDGLSGGATSDSATLYLNLNELSGSRTHPLAADHIAVLDSGDKGTKKLTITNLVSAITASNGGLDATSGKLSISGSALSDGTVAVGSDEFIFIDSDGSPKRETIADLATAMAGVGLSAGSGQLALHFAEIGSVALASTDSVMVLDNNSATKRSTVTQLGTYLCGSNGGLAHTAGVLTISGSNLADGTVDFDNDQIMFIDSDGAPKRETITDLFSAISGTTAEFNNITATVTSTAAVFSGSGISTFHKTNSDTAHSTVFSGSGISTIHKVNADHIAIVGSLDLGDQNIANVGDISLDSISSDGSLVTINAPSEIANGSSGGATALIIDNDDTDEIALAIEAANIDADVIDITADAVTTANVIDITADALTSGKALNIVSDSSDTTARNIALIHQDHASATAATTLRVVQDSTAPALHVQGPVVTGVMSVPSNNTNGQTVTVVNMLKGTHTAMNRGSSKTDTLDTAANIVAAIPNAVVGDAFNLLILNIGSNSVTFAGGTGTINLAGSAASFTIAANNGRMFKFLLSNVSGGSESVTMCPISDSFATTS